MTPSEVNVTLRTILQSQGCRRQPAETEETASVADPIKTSWSENSALNPPDCDWETEKRAVQRVGALPHRPEVSAVEDTAICLGFRAFTHVKVFDPDQRGVLASN